MAFMVTFTGGASLTEGGSYSFAITPDGTQSATTIYWEVVRKGGLVITSADLTSASSGEIEVAMGDNSALNVTLTSATDEAGEVDKTFEIRVYMDYVDADNKGTIVDSQLVTLEDDDRDTTDFGARSLFGDGADNILGAATTEDSVFSGAAGDDNYTITQYQYGDVTVSDVLAGTDNIIKFDAGVEITRYSESISGGAVTEFTVTLSTGAVITIQGPNAEKQYQLGDGTATNFDDFKTNLLGSTDLVRQPGAIEVPGFVISATDVADLSASPYEVASGSPVFGTPAANANTFSQNYGGTADIAGAASDYNLVLAAAANDDTYIITRHQYGDVAVTDVLAGTDNIIKFDAAVEITRYSESISGGAVTEFTVTLSTGADITIQGPNAEKQYQLGDGVATNFDDFKTNLLGSIDLVRQPGAIEVPGFVISATDVADLSASPYVVGTPTIQQALTDLTVVSGGTEEIDLNDYFDNDDGDDTLTYTVDLTRFDNTLTTATLAGNLLTIISLGTGEDMETLTVTATDRYGASVDSAEFTVTVEGMSDVPVEPTADGGIYPLTYGERVLVFGDENFNDGNGRDTVTTLTITGLPSGGTLYIRETTDNVDGSEDEAITSAPATIDLAAGETLYFQTTEATGGSVSPTFTYTVTDNSTPPRVSMEGTITLSITPPAEHLPSSGDYGATAEFGAAKMLLEPDLLDTNGDVADGTVDTITITAIPASGTLFARPAGTDGSMDRDITTIPATIDLSTGETLYYQAAATGGPADVAAGAEFTYTITDNDGNVSAVSYTGTITLSVPAGHVPTTSDNVGSEAIYQDHREQVSPDFADSVQGDDTVTTITITTLPTQGTLYVRPMGNMDDSGDVAITAVGDTIDLSTGQTLWYESANTNVSDAFDFTVTDENGNTSTASTYTIALTTQNDDPMAEDISYALPAATETVDLVLDYSDPDGTIVSITFASGYDGVILVNLNGDGMDANYVAVTAGTAFDLTGSTGTPAFRYQSPASTISTTEQSITYTVIDNLGGDAEGIITLTVAPTTSDSTTGADYGARITPVLSFDDVNGMDNVVSVTIVTTAGAGALYSRLTSDGTDASNDMELSAGAVVDLTTHTLYYESTTKGGRIDVDAEQDSFTFSVADVQGNSSNTSTARINLTVSEDDRPTNIDADTTVVYGSGGVPAVSGALPLGYADLQGVNTVSTISIIGDLPMGGTLQVFDSAGNFVSAITDTARTVDLSAGQTLRFAAGDDPTPSDRTDIGMTSFRYTVTDEDENTSPEATFTIMITSENLLPTAENITLDLPSATTEVEIDFAANTNDANGTVASVTILTIPSEGMLVVRVNGVQSTVGMGDEIDLTSTTSFFYISPADISATAQQSFTYRVTDNDDGESEVATVTFSVTPKTMDSDEATFYGEEELIELSYTDINGDTTVTTATITELPTAGTLYARPMGNMDNTGDREITETARTINLGAGETLYYVPTADTGGTTGETDSFMFTVTDNGATETATSDEAEVTITLSTDPADIPTTMDGDGTATHGNPPMQITPNYEDAQGRSTITTLTIVTATTNGQLSARERGTTTDTALVAGDTVNLLTHDLFYQATPGTTTSDSFTYTVTDANGNTSTPAATFDITIEAANLAPVADAINVAMPAADGRVELTLSAADQDEGSVVSYRFESVPTSGQLILRDSSGNEQNYTAGSTITVASIAAGTQIFFVAAADLSGVGAQTFSYVAIDNENEASEAATITINVNPTSQGGAVGANHNILTPIDLGYDDVNGFSTVSSATITDLTDNGSLIRVAIADGAETALTSGDSTIDFATHTLHYRGTNTNEATDSFEFTVTDADGNRSTASTFNITLSALPTSIPTNALGHYSEWDTTAGRFLTYDVNGVALTTTESYGSGTDIVRIGGALPAQDVNAVAPGLGGDDVYYVYADLFAGNTDTGSGLPTVTIIDGVGSDLLRFQAGVKISDVSHTSDVVAGSPINTITFTLAEADGAGGYTDIGNVTVDRVTSNFNLFFEGQAATTSLAALHAALLTTETTDDDGFIPDWVVTTPDVI